MEYTYRRIEVIPGLYEKMKRICNLTYECDRSDEYSVKKIYALLEEENFTTPFLSHIQIVLFNVYYVLVK